MFSDLKNNNELKIRTFNGNTYTPLMNSIKLLSNLDLATIQFYSNSNYEIPSINSSKDIRRGAEIWVTGFPPSSLISDNIIPMLYPGRLIGKQKRTFEGEELLYSNPIQPGTSGGGVLTKDGLLIGINVAQSLDTRALEKGIKLGNGINMGVPIDYYINPNKIPYKNSRAYIKSGEEKTELEDYDGAISDFNKALEINPNYPRAYRIRGATKFQLKDYSGAISDYNKALTINPEDADSFFLRGVLKLIELEDYDGAISDLNKAIEINPEDVDAYVNRGNAKLKLDNSAGALSDYNKALIINPEDADAYYFRSLTKKYFLGDSEGADSDLKRSQLLKRKSSF